MTKATIAGLIILGLPLMAVALMIFWRRQRAVIAFAMALVTVGLGYLAITGAAADIARKVPLIKSWIAETGTGAAPAKAGAGSPKPQKGAPGEGKSDKTGSAKPDSAKPDSAKPDPATASPVATSSKTPVAGEPAAAAPPAAKPAGGASDAAQPDQSPAKP